MRSAPLPCAVLAWTLILVISSSAQTSGDDSGDDSPGSLLDRPPEDFVSSSQEDLALPDRELVERSMSEGVSYLLSSQNDDGSWGSFEKPAHEFWSNPFTHQAWVVGTSALGLMCLLEAPADQAVDVGIERSLRFLLEHPPLRRPSDWDVDNTWGDIYALQALCDALEHPIHGQGQHADALRSKIEEHVAAMGKMQAPDGGWGYYDFETKTVRPSWSTSFMTATAILGLLDAGQLGIALPDKMLSRAVAALERCLLPTGAYTYSVTLFPSPGRAHGINQVKGSLSRIQVGNLALHRAGSELIDHDDLLAGLDAFFRDHRFLDVARKKPYPHEAYYQNSGYFYFFGHFYAAQVLEQLEPAEQLRYRSRLAREVVKTAEDDGSMWDFYINTYHKPYGTAFGVMALRRTTGREL
jgi:hypothetical protein